MKKFSMSRAEAAAHQQRHGFAIPDETPAERKRKLPDGNRIQSGRQMNKTEREFSRSLEAQRRQGEILRYEYEGMTLRWGGMRYTPDFTVLAEQYQPTSKNPDAEWVLKTMKPWVKLKFIEVKGGFIRDDALVKFKAFKAAFPEFEFEFWQKADGQWIQLYRKLIP